MIEVELLYSPLFYPRSISTVGCSERRKELKRRRHRKRKLAHYKSHLAKASVSDKSVIADKLRKLTVGADEIIATLELEER
jgi:hypothetical protein